jgi:hypothetical protein
MYLCQVCVWGGGSRERERERKRKTDRKSLLSREMSFKTKYYFNRLRVFQASRFLLNTHSFQTRQSFLVPKIFGLKGLNLNSIN